MLDPLALGAVLFKRSDFKAVAGDVREETIWLAGIDGIRRFDDLAGDGFQSGSLALQPSGVYAMSGSGQVRHQLVINAGPAESGRNGHRHADALSVQLTIDGHPVLIDPGTCAYVDQGDDRNRYRGTAAHNTISVDGFSQAEPNGPFGWRGLTSSEVKRWVIGNTFDFFEGSHNGYARLATPVNHQRSVFYWKPHFWLVRDVLEGAGKHQCAAHWHLAEGSLTAIPGGVAFLGSHQTALSLLVASSCSWSLDVCPDWYSPVYGRIEPASLLRCTTEGMLPVELVSLLIPTVAVGAKLDILELAESQAVCVRAYRYSGGTADYLFIFANSSRVWQVGPWSSDAKFLFCAADRAEKTDCFVMCDGSYLAMNGRTVLAAREGLKYAEFFHDGQRQQFCCSRGDVVEINPLTQTAERASRAVVPSAV